MATDNHPKKSNTTGQEKYNGRKSGRRNDNDFHKHRQTRIQQQQHGPAVVSILARGTDVTGQSDRHIQGSNYATESTTFTPAGVPSISPILHATRITTTPSNDHDLDDCDFPQKLMSERSQNLQRDKSHNDFPKVGTDNEVSSKPNEHFGRGIVTSKKVFDHRHDPVPLIKGKSRPAPAAKGRQKQGSRRLDLQTSYITDGVAAIEEHGMPTLVRSVVKRDKWKVDRVDTNCYVPRKDFVLQHRMDESEHGINNKSSSWNIKKEITVSSISDLDVLAQPWRCIQGAFEKGIRTYKCSVSPYRL